MRQTVKIALTLLVVAALAMTGIALAQSSDAPSSDVAPDGSRLQASILERLAPLVEDGTISDDQAEAVATRLAETATDRPRHRPGFKVMVEALEFLGVTPEEAREALGEGQKLAELAEANGSSAEELVAFLLGEIEEHVAQGVADGKITEEQQAEILENAEERLTAMVNGEIDLPRPHDRHPGHHRGPGRDAPAGDDA